MKIINLTSKQLGTIKAELLEARAPKTCNAIWNALPLEVSLARWGEELYGSIPVQVGPENPQEECEVGDIAYWLEGSGFCILFE